MARSIYSPRRGSNRAAFVSARCRRNPKHSKIKSEIDSALDSSRCATWFRCTDRTIDDSRLNAAEISAVDATMRRIPYLCCVLLTCPSLLRPDALFAQNQATQDLIRVLSTTTDLTDEDLVKQILHQA